jgi:hypothetical protein
VEYPLRAPGGGSNVNPLRLNCQQVVFRWGKELDGTLTRTIATVFDKPWGAAWQIANSHLLSQKEPQKQGPQVCVKTQGWQSDQEFLSRLKIDPPPKPQLFAKFVAGFDSPDPGGNQKSGQLVFRIRVWAPPDTEARGQESDSTADPSNEADILRPPQRVRIRYDLHPAEGNRPVTRMGFGADRAIWINTRNDYPIRVRTGDGLEWNGHTVLGALFSWYFGEPAVPPEADRSLDTTIEMKVWNANTGAFELNAAKPVRVALSDLIRQTASNNG